MFLEKTILKFRSVFTDGSRFLCFVLEKMDQDFRIVLEGKNLLSFNQRSMICKKWIKD